MKRSRWTKWVVAVALPLLLLALLWPVAQRYRRRANTQALLAELETEHPEMSRVRYLLDHEADPNARHPSQANTLQLAMHCDQPAYPSVFSMLLNYGADPNLSSNGTPILCQAVEENKVDIVRILLARGAAVNLRNSFGYTALDSVLIPAPDLGVHDSFGQRIKRMLLRAGAKPGRKK